MTLLTAIQNDNLIGSIFCELHYYSKRIWTSTVNWYKIMFCIPVSNGDKMFKYMISFYV